VADDAPPSTPDGPATIVVVDDDRFVLELVRHVVAELPAVRVVTFENATAALQWCHTNEPDVIITDYDMPGLSGLELIAAVRRERHAAEVPIMMITASGHGAVRVEALDRGANDVLSKPIEAAEVRARTKNMLAIRRGQRLLAQRSSWLEEEVHKATAAIASRERETILRLSKAAEYRDWETGSHIVRVSLYARVVARQLSLPSSEQETLFQAAPMHDVGKIGIPDSILLKPGALDAEEFDLIKQHTVIGHGILGGSSSGLLQAAAEIALTHHERFDGSGYPNEMAGEAIPLLGRIVAVADTFDALTSRRPYKSAWPPELAWRYLEQNQGTRFDPACVEAFLQARADAEEIRAALPDAVGEGFQQRQGFGASAAAADGL
jgi:response regulator RpfG family c-di-GMP phosphodiesterase